MAVRVDCIDKDRVLCIVNRYSVNQLSNDQSMVGVVGICKRGKARSMTTKLEAKIKCKSRCGIAFSNALWPDRDGGG